MSLQPAIDLLIRSASREETDKYTPAVGILKAAEKVDKKITLTVLNRWKERLSWIEIVDWRADSGCRNSTGQGAEMNKKELLDWFDTVVQGAKIKDRDEGPCEWCHLDDGVVAQIRRLISSSGDKGAFDIVKEQANDSGLWFSAKTAPEAYLQQELRRLHMAIEGRMPAQIIRSLSSSSKPAEVGGWVPTPKNINALPKPIRKYVHDIETLCDPAGIIAENTIAKDIISAQEKQITADQEALIAAEQFAGEMIPLLKAVNKIDSGEAEVGEIELEKLAEELLKYFFGEFDDSGKEAVIGMIEPKIRALLRQPRTVSKRQMIIWLNRLLSYPIFSPNIQTRPVGEICELFEIELYKILAELGYAIEELKEEGEGKSES